jgi:hypothetical protein
MSYYHDHTHTSNVRGQFRAGSSTESYASVVGTIDTNTETPITGRHGDHLKFYVEVGNGTRYQVDVNTQSEDGSMTEMYIADQDVNPSGANPDEPFGAPAYGVFPNAQLSYKAMGLNDNDFAPAPDNRIDSQLCAALNGATFVAIYGFTYDDGGPDGKGIHKTHFNGDAENQDGAIAVYSVDSNTNKPIRTWFFFKFQEDSLD